MMNNKQSFKWAFDAHKTKYKSMMEKRGNVGGKENNLYVCMMYSVMLRIKLRSLNSPY